MSPLGWFLLLPQAPSRASARSESDAQAARLRVAPPYLQGRVEQGQDLPRVEVTTVASSGDGRGEGSVEGEEEERRRAVAAYAVMGGMNRDVYDELTLLMDWTCKRVRVPEPK